MTRVRPDVVGLLSDVVLDLDAPPDTWRRNDGHALTKGEIDMVLSATVAELQAVVVYSNAITARYEQHATAIARAEELAAPHLAQLPPGAGLPEVLAAMPAGPEREEFTRLVEAIADGPLGDRNGGGEASDPLRASDARSEATGAPVGSRTNGSTPVTMLHAATVRDAVALIPGVIARWIDRCTPIIRTAREASLIKRRRRL